MIKALVYDGPEVVDHFHFGRLGPGVSFVVGSDPDAQREAARAVAVGILREPVVALTGAPDTASSSVGATLAAAVADVTQPPAPSLTVEPWHGAGAGVHHNRADCRLGNNVEAENRRPGTGDRPLCTECARRARKE